ncbi:MAG: YibE/F family protein [Oscillospiraceae bacterium]|jgi:uncharacterized membrane protein|nr:YibE/F family protein [Oscillospiraceae bacterium]
MRLNLKAALRKDRLVYALALLASAVFLLVGNRIAVGERQVFGASGQGVILRARVLQIMTDEQSSYDISAQGGNGNTLRSITFRARLLEGESKRQTVTAVQEINDLYGQREHAVAPGDTVLLDLLPEDTTAPENASDPATGQPPAAGASAYLFLSFTRTTPLLLLAGCYAFLVLFFARKKGFDTLLSMGITILAIFAVLLPAVLTGRNIYVWTVVICAFVIFTNLLLVQGLNAKSLTAAAGCLGGLFCPALIAALMQKPMHLTGLMDEDAVMLTYLDPPINVRATISCMFLIGCVGALMDITMTIVSAVHEIHEKEPELPARELMKSGNSIGKDVIGTMANTLVLAFIGGSMSEILLLVNYSGRLTQVLNLELVSVEILQSLASCFSVVLTIPLTSFLCTLLMQRRTKKTVA